MYMVRIWDEIYRTKHFNNLDKAITYIVEQASNGKHIHLVEGPDGEQLYYNERLVEALN